MLLLAPPGMACSHSVKLVEPTPCGQHVIVVPTGNHIDPQMWHIMSNALVTTFKGNHYSSNKKSKKMCVYILNVEVDLPVFYVIQGTAPR